MENSLLQRDPVVERNGGLHVRPAGVAVPLLMNGAPVRGFLRGWRAELLYTGLAPLFVLQLLHQDGRRATWFLDHRLQHVGDNVAAFAPEAMALLRQTALPLLRRLLRTLLECGQPVLDGALEAFLSLQENVRLEIAAPWIAELVTTPQLLLVDELQPQSLLFRGEGQESLSAISREHLASGLQAEFQDRVGEFARDRAISWASPVDGQRLRSQGGFCFDDFFFAYRFFDARYGLVFFVLTGGHLSRVGGLWFPSLNLIVCKDAAGAGIAHLLLPHLAHLVVTQACRWGAAIASAWRRGMHRIASVTRGLGGAHIGHQLWNELSGIEHFLRQAPAALPDWIVLDAAQGTEFFGPIDHLFPELAGHVERGLSGKDALVQYAYREGAFILRVTREHVSAALRHKILNWARETAPPIQTSPGSPVLVFGLRVENRTVDDLPGFAAALLEGLIARYPGLTVIFDGHNERPTSSGSAPIQSYGESYAGRAPIDVERELVEQMRQRFRSAPVSILDTIGKPVATSIAWTDHADAFFSIWGASLSKYRWVCNKPGLTLTSMHNLAHRADLHIYDSPDYMENPSRLDFVGATLVCDLPEASRLVDIHPGDPAFSNFKVDVPHLLVQLTGLIDEVRGGKQAAALEGAPRGRQRQSRIADQAGVGQAAEKAHERSDLGRG